MNDPNDDFEVQLRSLKPAAPAPLLADRIAEVLSTRPRTAPGHTSTWRAQVDRWFGPVPSFAWAIGAAVIVMGGLAVAIMWPGDDATSTPALRLGDRRPETAEATSPPNAAPVQFARAVSTPQAVHDDGLVKDDSGAIARRVRYEFTDTLEWRDSETGAQVVVSFPREEVFSSTLRAF